MTDGLLDLDSIFTAVGALVSNYGGYLAIVLGVYLGLFLVGLAIEAVRSAKSVNEGR